MVDSRNMWYSWLLFAQTTSKTDHFLPRRDEMVGQGTVTPIWTRHRSKKNATEKWIMTKPVQARIAKRPSHDRVYVDRTVGDDVDHCIVDCVAVGNE